MYKFISICTVSHPFFEMYFFVDGFKLCFNLKLIVNFTLQVKLPQMDEPAQIML
jgi:hypothetical protein